MSSNRPVRRTKTAGAKWIWRLGSPTAAQVSRRADDLEARIGDPADPDDSRWLGRKVSVLRKVAAKRKKRWHMSRRSGAHRGTDELRLTAARGPITVD